NTALPLRARLELRQVPLFRPRPGSRIAPNRRIRHRIGGGDPLLPTRSRGRFSYSALALDRASIPTDASVTVSVEVTNTPDREAAEVVQLYLHQRHGSASRPVRERKGFQRGTLPAHASERVQFTIGPDQRRYWSTAAQNWVLDSSTF